MLNSLLVRRDFGIALAGRIISTFGDGVALVALTVRLQSDGARPYEVGLLLGAGVIPQVVLARPVGRLVDSRDSRHLLVGAGLTEAASAGALVVMHSAVAIVALAAVLGAASSVAGTTWSALIPRIVGEDAVARAMSAQQSLQAVVLVGAPAAGGLLAGTFGTGLPLAIDAATFLVLTGAAALVRTRRRLPAEPDRCSSDTRDGFAILRTDRVLGPLVVGVVAVVLLVGMADVVLVFLVRDTLHAGATWYGIAEATWMAGMVAGSVGAGLLRTERARIWATISGAGLACAAVIPFAVIPAVWMLVPLSVLGGIGNGYAAVCFSTLLISRTPDAARGRVSAAAGAALGGAQGLSLLAGGAIAAVVSYRAIYATAGTLGTAVAVTIGVFYAARTTSLGRRVLPQREQSMASAAMGRAGPAS